MRETRSEFLNLHKEIHDVTEWHFTIQMSITLVSQTNTHRIMNGGSEWEPTELTNSFKLFSVCMFAWAGEKERKRESAWFARFLFSSLRFSCCCCVLNVSRTLVLLKRLFWKSQLFYIKNFSSLSVITRWMLSHLKRYFVSIHFWWWFCLCCLCACLCVPFVYPHFKEI